MIFFFPLFSLICRDSAIAVGFLKVCDLQAVVMISFCNVPCNLTEVALSEQFEIEFLTLNIKWGPSDSCIYMEQF